jgi:hypothetical protein
MTAPSKSSAVATTNASTACSEDSLAFASSPPARCAMLRVTAQTTIPRSFNSRSMALSNLGPRQTSARTAAGTLTNARRSCATCRIARERSANTARSVAWASALTASESRISASAKTASPCQERLCSLAHARHRAQRETRRVVHARVRVSEREPQIPTAHGPPRDGAPLSQVRRERSRTVWLRVVPY